MSFSKLIQAIQKREVAPIYCLYGTESYLSDIIVKTIRSVYVDPAYADFNDSVVDAAKSEVSELLTQFDTLPFFQEKRVVLVRDCAWFGTQKTGLSEDDEAKVMAYLENPSPQSIVIFLANSVDKRKKIGKMLQKQGVLFDCAKVEELELRKIIVEKLNDSGCEISQENLQYCIYLLGYMERDSDRTLYDVIGQVERLIASASQSKIDRALLDRVLEKPLDTNIFALIDAISDGKTLDAAKIKQQLLSEDMNEIQITSMLFKHFRNLYKTVLWLDKGYNPTAIAEKLGVHPFSAKKYTAQCRQFKVSYLKQVIIDLSEMDYAMKTGGIAFSDALDFMTVCLSKRERLPVGLGGKNEGINQVL